MQETVTYNVDPPVNSPGAILKRCREYHGISLEEAAESTKIGTNYLKALEEDQTKDFASLAYLKGFLRIYANYLGLNPDDVMRLYEKLYAPAGARKEGQTGSGDSSERIKRRFPWQKLALPAILLLLLLITAGIINRSTPRPLPVAAPKAVAPAQPAAVILPVRSSVRPPPPVQKTAVDNTSTKEVKSIAPASEKNEVKPQASDSDKGFIVRMKVIQNGSLIVTIDGAAAQNYDLTSGDFFEWKAEKNIALDLSNAGGVEVEMNGKQLKPFGPVGKPASVMLDAEGAKQ